MERLIDVRKVGKKFQFLVSWRGFGREQDSWQDESDLDDGLKREKNALKRKFAAEQREKKRK